MKSLNQEILKFDYEQNFQDQDFYVSKSNEFSFLLLNSWPKWEKNFINLIGEKFSGKSHLINIFLHKFKGIKINAADISNEALELAKRNLKAIVPNANVRFSLGDWWEPLKRWSGRFDLVLSNPPYIPTDLVEELEPVVKNHEPIIALDGGEDGMNSSRKIILGALNGLAKGGWLILEHHYDQSEKITSFMKNIVMEEDSFEKYLILSGD